MKRPIAATLWLLLAGLAACGDGRPAPAETTDAQNAWATPPVIDSVRTSPDGVVISGRANPGSRVRFTGAEGVAYGGSADAEGRFEPTADGAHVVALGGGILPARLAGRDSRVEVAVDGEPAGVLEDYGAVAEAFCAVHQLTGEGRWLDLAGTLLDTALQACDRGSLLTRQLLAFGRGEALARNFAISTNCWRSRWTFTDVPVSVGYVSNWTQVPGFRPCGWIAPSSRPRSSTSWSTAATRCPKAATSASS